MAHSIASILWLTIVFGCTSSGSKTRSFTQGDVFFEMVEDSFLWGTSTCVTFLNSVSMTSPDGCVKASVETKDGVSHVSFLAEAGVGEVTYTARIQNEVVKLPDIGSEGFVEGVLENQALSRLTLQEGQQAVQTRIVKHRQEWEAGAFSLQTSAGEIKGALVFDTEGVRIFVFDTHWLTPEVQYATLESDGLDWMAEFETEPQFFDSSTYIRIHFLEQTVSIPHGPKRTEYDIEYKMVPNPPSFEQLETLQNQQIQKSILEEKESLIEAVNKIYPMVDDKKQCVEWSPEYTKSPVWIGYSVTPSWKDDRCEFYIEPETVQYRRTFVGTLNPELN